MNDHRGKPYQQLVAQIAEAFDQCAEVSEGEWIAGPDGRLDMDVAIRGNINGKKILTVIECKDFNPVSTGKVGRGFVDALDSKRHDLGASFAIICSNSGFTADALHKAKRKGIGMISVLRQGDDRVEAEILEEILLRRIRFGDCHFTYHGEENIRERLADHNAMHHVLYNGLSLDSWLRQRAWLIALENPIITKRILASFHFKEPLIFTYREEQLILHAADISFVYKTEWLCQTVRLDAALGIYDYLRGCVLLAQGDNKYVIQGVDWDIAKPCDAPEDPSLISTGLLPGQIDIKLIAIEGLNTGEVSEVPQLEPFVEPNDLECKIPTDE